MKNYLKILTFVVTGLAAGTTGRADTLADPRYTLQEYGHAYVHQTGTISGSSLCCNGLGSESYSATLNAMSSPSVEAFATSTYAGLDGGYADLRYSFEITGADGFVPLDIFAHFLVDYDCTGNICDSSSDAVGLYMYYDNTCCFLNAQTSNGFHEDGSSAFSLSQGLGFGELYTTFQKMVPTNKVVTVDMYALAISGYDGHAHSLIDQYHLDFSQGFDSTGYALAFSPGIGNSSPDTTPEPGTVSLMLGALCGMAVWGRRRLSHSLGADHCC